LAATDRASPGHPDWTNATAERPSSPRFRALRHHCRCVCSSRHVPHHPPTPRNHLVM